MEFGGLVGDAVDRTEDGIVIRIVVEQRTAGAEGTLGQAVKTVVVVIGITRRRKQIAHGEIVFCVIFRFRLAVDGIVDVGIF